MAFGERVDEGGPPSPDLVGLALFSIVMGHRTDGLS